ncbi:ammonium transporter [Sinorhizobium sp. BJ1]|uniref:ammonium transporter n=1 Tax=Sinorhizobium sp. BJ1 TaxID=2035455 RepID=UPI000BE9FB6D|nr:ammonium transporter [Sinorhizobium sp. BJ1]
MKDKISSASQKVAAAAKARPAETRWSLLGAAGGAILGLLVGGVGITAMGGGAGVPAAVILALVGGVLGNRFGISKDRPVRDRKMD